MNCLNTDVLSIIKSFIGDESYISFSFNKYFESQWDKPKKTRAITKFTSNNMLTMSLEYGLKKTEKLCEFSAFYNRLDLLCIFKALCIDWGDTCKISVENKNIELFKWAIKHKAPWKKAEICRLAAYIGEIDFLDWLQYKCCYSSFMFCCEGASENGQLETLKWLRNRHFYWDEHSLSAACFYGHFEVVKWMVENRCPISEGSCSSAAFNGHLKILKWIREKGFPWDERVCDFAALNGNFETLKWAHDNGAPWDCETFTSAASGGYLYILKWLYENNCPSNKNACTEAAINGDIEILKWIKEKKLPWDPSVFSICIVYNHIDVIEWLSK